MRSEPVSTGVEALELQSGLRDLGNNTRVTSACNNPRSDDHSTSGIRYGETRAAARDEGRLYVVKLRTERNPADLVTKPLPFNRTQELCKFVGVEYDQDSMTREAQFSVPVRGVPEAE